jgi:hypothetical protein
MSIEQDIFRPENKIETTEHLSPSGKYRLVIQKYKSGIYNCTKGSIYSSNQWVGEIRRENNHFPFLFFQKSNGNELLIGGRTPWSQTIINCQTGHVYDNSDSSNVEGFRWNKIRQLDSQTICVEGYYWGGPSMYQFYDFSNLNLGWPRMEVVQYPDLPLPNYHYILMDHDLAGERNYLDPLIKNSCITFEVKECRVKGVANLVYRKLKRDEIELNVKSYVDFGLRDYIYQLDDEFQCWKLEKDYRECIYCQDMARMTFSRIKNKIRMVEFWRSKQRIHEDQQQDDEEVSSEEQSDGQSERRYNKQQEHKQQEHKQQEYKQQEHKQQELSNQDNKIKLDDILIFLGNQIKEWKEVNQEYIIHNNS